MNGAHDLGGMHGFEAVDHSQKENFRHEWEEKVFALTLACGMLGKWNLDQSRFARERADPAEYLAGSYYEHWLHGLEILLLESGLVTEDELSQGATGTQGREDIVAASPQRVDEILSSGGPTLMNDIAPARFSVGDMVVVKVHNTTQHTRAPGYVQGKVGQIELHHGSHIFADEHAASGSKTPEHLYGVRFEPDSLWGEGGRDRGAVYADLFEPYLMSLSEHMANLHALLKTNEGNADE